MNLIIIPLVLAMGDPNFLPANPPIDSKADSMAETTKTLNQIDQEETKQLQEERTYNQNEDKLNYQLDDAFQEATESKPEKSKEDL